MNVIAPVAPVTVKSTRLQVHNVYIHIRTCLCFCMLGYVIVCVLCAWVGEVLSFPLILYF